VLAVLTGADWEAFGWGDLPSASGNKQRDGSPAYRPRYPALVKDRVRWVGDYVAFVIAESAHQAADAAELISVDYEPLPAIVSTGDAIKPGVPLVWDDCPNNIGFIQIEGNKEATDAAFAGAAHVVKHHFVVNRVTAAAMEPRGSIGLYDATEGRYTIYTTLQRTNVFQTELANYVLKVPDNKIRVVAGDIGGSFGMKSAVYNEVALVLLGAKITGRPVKWVATRSESFLCDAQARDNVTDAELALDQDGHFLGFRAKIIAAIGAYLQVGRECDGGGAPVAANGRPARTAQPRACSQAAGVGAPWQRITRPAARGGRLHRSGSQSAAPPRSRRGGPVGAAHPGSSSPCPQPARAGREQRCSPQSRSREHRPRRFRRCRHSDAPRPGW